MATVELRMSKIVFGVLCVLALFGTLCFAAQSYADETDVAAKPFDKAGEVELADGVYTIDVEKAGGSGKADITSPTKLEVSGGRAVATILWSSEYYDYMLVDGQKYLPVYEDTSKGSYFEIPVTVYDEAMSVVGDTTAMGQPHEVEYTFTFSLSSVVEGEPAWVGEFADAMAKQAEEANLASSSSSASSAATSQVNPLAIGGVFAALLVVGIVLGTVVGRRANQT